MQIELIESDRTASIQSQVWGLQVFTEAGSRGLSREDFRQALENRLRFGDGHMRGRALQFGIKQADRVRKALANAGATFEHDRASGCYIMSRPPEWAVPVGTDLRLALKTAREVLQGIGAVSIAGQIESLEELSDRQPTAGWQRPYQRLIQQKALCVIGGLDVEPTPATMEQFSELVEILADPVRKEIAVRGGWPHGFTRMYPHSLIVDIYSRETYFLGLNLDSRAPLFHPLSDLPEILVQTRPALISPEEQEYLERARDHQLAGFIGWEDDPFTVRVRPCEERLQRAWHQGNHPTLPGFSACEDSEDLPYGSYQFQCNHIDGPARWALQFGGTIEVIEPEAVRTKLKELSKTLLQANGG